MFEYIVSAANNLWERFMEEHVDNTFLSFSKQVEAQTDTADGPIVPLASWWLSIQTESCFVEIHDSEGRELVELPLVPFVCLNKHRWNNARKIALGDLRPSGRTIGPVNRHGERFSSFWGRGRGDCEDDADDADGGGTPRGMFNASLNISMSNIALTRGI